jgi:hypothetical protein
MRKLIIAVLLLSTMACDFDPNREVRERAASQATLLIGHTWTVLDAQQTGKFGDMRRITIEDGSTRHQLDACNDTQFILVTGDRFTAEIIKSDSGRWQCYFVANRVK